MSWWAPKYIYIKKQETYIYISKYEIQMISSIWMKDIVIKENENCKKKNAFYLVIWGLNFLTDIGGQTTVLIVQKGNTTSNAVVLSSFSSDVHSV